MSIWKERVHVFLQYSDLLKQLVKRDVKLKYRRSVLGYVWSILNPLLIMIIMTLVFSTMFDRNIENFPVYLITGRTIFEFMTTSTNAAMRSIVGNGALLKKCYVPKYIFTLAKVTSSLVDFVFSLGALVIVIVFTKAPITPYILFTPLVMIQLYLFCCGLGFLLASMNVFFRDVQHIYKAVTTAWMYLTPIFYPIERLPKNILFFVKGFNPMYYYVAQFRDMVYSGHFPGPRIFWGGWLIAIVMFLIGIIVFKKNQDKFILYI
ncbi:MAG: ABC transporter permease [Lachnospiraceae bacterium]|nr:ABC transporter permease [Lachnospiraceae bacterium]